MGKSWQAGECNPSSECIIADIGCFQDASGCRRWHKEQQVASICEVQKECSSCLGSNKLCKWDPRSGCSLGSDLWVPEAVFHQGEKCPEKEAASLERAGVLKETVLMD